MARFCIILMSKRSWVKDIEGMLKMASKVILNSVIVHYYYRAMLAQSAVMRLHVARPSVRLSVMFRYRVQIDLNSSKIISRPMCWLTPNMGDLVQREHPQNWG